MLSEAARLPSNPTVSFKQSVVLCLICSLTFSLILPDRMADISSTEMRSAIFSAVQVQT